jgi:hypothetical protein
VDAIIAGGSFGLIIIALFLAMHFGTLALAGDDEQELTVEQFMILEQLREQPR